MIKKPTKYYSKWKKKWISFKKEPTTKELNSLKKYKYKLK
jgi:hypothetical protein